MTIDHSGLPDASCIVYRKGPVTEFDFWVGARSLLGIFIRSLQMFKL